MIAPAQRLAVVLASVATLALAGAAQAEPSPWVSPAPTVAHAINAARASRGLPVLPPSKAAGTSEARMYEALNLARIHNGMPPLEISSGLTVASMHHARMLARRHLFQHAKVLTTTPGYSFVGEILARIPSKRPSIKAICDAWMASPEHSPIILDRQWKSMGVAAIHARYGRKWWTVWVVRFGNPG